MKDFNGNILEVGDTVAFLEPHYRNMVEGRVHSFTAKMIRVEYPLQGWRDGVKGIYPELCLREQAYVAKIQPKLDNKSNFCYNTCIDTET